MDFYEAAAHRFHRIGHAWRRAVSFLRRPLRIRAVFSPLSHRLQSAGRTIPLLRSARLVRGKIEAGNVGALPSNRLFLRSGARRQMIMTLRGSVCRGVPARRARDGARRHHTMPDQREGRLRFPKNFLKKRKDAVKRYCGAAARQARASMLADRGGAPPSQTRGRHARPVFLYGKLKPFDVLFTASRLWCCGSSKSAFMTFQRVTDPTAFDFGRNRLNVRKNRPMQLLQYGSFVYPPFYIFVGSGLHGKAARR